MDCCAGGNRRNGVGTIAAGGFDVCSAIDDGGTRRGGFSRRTSVELGCLGDVDVGGTGPTWMCDCASGNASTACGGGSKGGGNARGCTCGLNSGRGVGLGGACWYFVCTCAGVTEAACAENEGSCVGGNAGAACGGTRNDAEASEDRVEGDTMSRGDKLSGAQAWDWRVYRAAA
jgi:hypothetical protein